ncbi:hypothetical protein AADZ90_007830 [Aestuariibius sp. 2305UL40-4]|uniref:hypothetical protein n=1 Tax=Aestuariibius violaceus TaxID=3234132 RepID=UPI00345EDCB0
MLKKALAALLFLATPVQGQSVNDQIAVAEATARAYTDLGALRRAGWKKFGGDEPLMGEHWFPPGGADYVGVDRIDPARPSNFLFTEIGGQKRLVALSYNVWIAPGDPVPEGFAGSADVWHVHDAVAFTDAALEERPFLGAIAQGWLADEAAKRGGRTRLAMVHLWLIPNPDGRFADRNRTLPYLDLGLPVEWANGASMAAAHGLALAGRDGCDEALDGKLWVAAADRRTVRNLKAVCGQLAAFVREDLGSKASANTRGARAWATLQREMNARLTPEEQARIAAISEHGEDHMGHGKHGGH